MFARRLYSVICPTGKLFELSHRLFTKVFTDPRHVEELLWRLLSTIVGAAKVFVRRLTFVMLSAIATAGLSLSAPLAATGLPAEK